MQEIGWNYNLFSGEEPAAPTFYSLYVMNKLPKPKLEDARRNMNL